MADHLHIDIESFSEADLKAIGMYAYAEHPTTEILCVCFAVGDGPTHLWVPAESLPDAVDAGIRERMEPGAELFVQSFCPVLLAGAIDSTTIELAAHNAGFERTMLNGPAGQRLGVPRTPIERWICTAAKARAHGLPGALGDCAAALGTHPKDENGKGDMMQVVKPRRGKIKRYTPENSPDKFIKLYSYCADDVRAERDIDKTVPDLTPYERRVWILDQRINDRGVLVDVEMIDNVQALIAEYKAELEAKCIELTGLKPTQRDKIAGWIRANGWPALTDMQANTVDTLAAEDSPVPDNVKRVLRLYSTYGAKAIVKYQVMKEARCADGRLRGQFIYHGAGTGRWSSVLVQLQNLFRPVIDDTLVAIEAFAERSLEWVRTLYSLSPMKIFASCVRGGLVAAPGTRLIAIDFAGIESRGTAWVAGEEWELRAFQKQDTQGGPDNYEIAYANTFGGRPEDVNKPQRQKGKPIALSMGYEGGVGALVRMAKNYRVKLKDIAEAMWQRMTEELVESAEWLMKKMGDQGLGRRTFIALDAVKQLWRQAHPATRRLWADMKEAAILAVANPGKVYTIPNKKIMFKVQDRWLYMRLPSGRRLAYLDPVLDNDTVECPDCVQLCPACKDRWGTSPLTFLAMGCAMCDGSGKRLLENCATCQNKRRIQDLTRAVVQYQGVDTKTCRWMQTSSYGGKWTQNAVQATSRDLLVHGMLALEEAGYKIIMTVHDEIVCEMDDGVGSLEEASRIMCSLPNWAAGLPVAAEGWEGHRYRK